MIREIRIGELGKLEEAAREFYSASRFLGEFSLDRFCEIWAHLLNSGAGVIFADEHGQNGTRELAGVIGGIVHPELYGRELVAEEWFWFVREAHRGAGVRLYRRFEEWARERGAARLQMVHLFDSMPEKVAKFYLHSGFEPVEMRYQKALAKPAAPGIQVFDDFLPDPDAWRAEALKLEYKSLTFGENETYHGIAVPPSGEVPLRITERFPRATPTLSFFRKSPAGQVEPLFIHTDMGMGEWSAILYLNPDPPAGDGTTFWEHVATGERENPIPHMRTQEGQEPNGWRAWRTVEARFNRLLMFPSSYFHSRAIFANWGAGDGARLTQVVFGRGEIL